MNSIQNNVSAPRRKRNNNNNNIKFIFKNVHRLATYCINVEKINR